MDSYDEEKQEALKEERSSSIQCPEESDGPRELVKPVIVLEIRKIPA